MNERGGRKGLLYVSIFMAQLKRTRAYRVFLLGWVNLMVIGTSAGGRAWCINMIPVDKTGNGNIEEALNARKTSRKMKKSRRRIN